MLILCVHTIKGIFIADKRLLAEVSTASEVAEVVKCLSGVFALDFLLELCPLRLKLNNFFVIDFFFYFEFFIFFLDDMLKFNVLNLCCFEFFAKLVILRRSLAELFLVVVHFRLDLDESRIVFQTFMFLGLQLSLCLFILYS